MAVQQLLAAYGPAGGGGGAELYWRIYITETRTGDSFFCSIGEIEMRASAGGPDECVGGTATGSTEESGTPASNAFDGDPSTVWATFSGAAGPAWIEYAFPSAVEIVQIVLTTGGTSARAARMPRTFDVQKSADGATWETVWSVVDTPAYGDTEARVFTKP